MDVSELAELMKAVERDFAKREKALYNPMRRTMEPIRLDMNAGAPVDDGILNKSHRTSRLRRSRGRGVTALRTGPSTGRGKIGGESTKLAGWRAHFSEFGTTHSAGTGYLNTAISKHWPTLEARLAGELREEFDKRLRRYKKRRSG